MSPTLTPVGISGLGVYVPERVLSNQDLEKMVDTSDEWIVSRTGIRERRICAPGESTSDLGAAAARAALADASLTPDDLDLIICCTFTPDHLIPATACLIQHKLGVSRPIPAFDLNAACTGFIYGLATAAAFIQSGAYRRILLIGAEATSRIVDYQDRRTCVLFGDGAGAVILEPCEPGRGLLASKLGADGSGADMLITRAGAAREPVSTDTLAARRQFIEMDGNEVYKFATRILDPVLNDALAALGDGHTAQDLELIIPHQANSRIIAAAARKLGVPIDRFAVNVDKYGNTSAASIPLAMADMREAGRLRPGALIGLVAFGGGLTYGASIWRW